MSDAAATDLGYTKSEIMIAASARQLDAVRNCFVGVGLPNIVCNLAQRTVSPDLQLVYESGVFGARPERLPLSIGDPTLVTGATAVTSMFELFAYYLQAGLIDVAFLGAAQIDRFGNINTTVIGDYDHPKVRLPGSGGACEIAINARQVMVIMRQGTRSFVETIDFRTSPGHSRGSGARRGARLVGQRSHERGDGPGHVRVRRIHGRDDAHDTASRCHAGTGPRQHGVGAAGRRRSWGDAPSVRRGAPIDPRGARSGRRLHQVALGGTVPTMPERDRGTEPSPWADPAEMKEPEPDWAKEIRARRKARAERLRKVFDGFDGQPLKRPPGSKPEPPAGDAG